MIYFNCFLILSGSLLLFLCSTVCATLDFCFFAMALAVVFDFFLENIPCSVSVALSVVLNLVLKDICYLASCSVSK